MPPTETYSGVWWAEQREQKAKKAWLEALAKANEARDVADKLKEQWLASQKMLVEAMREKLDAAD